MPFQILDFQADPTVLRQRILTRQQSGGDASEATVEVLDDQLAHHEPLSETKLEQTIPVATQHNEATAPILKRLGY